MTIKQRQLVAYEYPLARADQMLEEKFWCRAMLDGVMLSTILTLNK